MRLNTHPADRKVMVNAIAEQLGLRAEYMRMPTYAFRIGALTVNRDGTIDSENTGLLEHLKPLLIRCGWLDEEKISEPAAAEEHAAPAKCEEQIPEPSPAEAEEPISELNGIVLRMPLTGLTDTGVKNLIRILYNRQRLFNRMLRLENGIHIESEAVGRLNDAELSELFDAQLITGFSIRDEQLGMYIPFEGIGQEDRWVDAGTLLAAIIRAAKEAKRVNTALQELGDHEKYLANAWLNRLGFGGPEHKALRRRLMHHLSGYAAFRNNDRMLAHRERLAEKRRMNRSNNEEVHEDE